MFGSEAAAVIRGEDVINKRRNPAVTWLPSGPASNTLYVTDQ
jgi:hypothetical protein